MIDHNYDVSLGPVDRKFQDQLRLWRNDVRVRAWCRQSDLISDQDQERWIKSQSEDPSIRMYIIFDHFHEPAGCCGLTSIDQLSQRAEFSLYINPEKRGRKLGTKTLKTLFTHGYKNLNLNLIWGETFRNNPAAELFRGLGMHSEGFRREFYFKDGAFVDAELFSMTRADWEKKRAAW